MPGKAGDMTFFIAFLSFFTLADERAGSRLPEKAQVAMFFSARL